MKTALIYISKTGHSSKIAKAISEELQIQADDVKTNPKLNNVDLLFIVGGIYGGQSMSELITYIKNIDKSMVKKVALITSCVSKKAKQDAVRELLVKNNIEVLTNEFICQGNFLFIGLGHPNKTDIDNAVSYAKKEVRNQVK